MPDLDHSDYQRHVLHAIDNAVVAETDSVLILPTLELFCILAVWDPALNAQSG